MAGGDFKLDKLELALDSSARSMADGWAGFDSSGWTVATAGGTATASRNEGGADPVGASSLLVLGLVLVGLAFVLKR